MCPGTLVVESYDTTIWGFIKIKESGGCISKSDCNKLMSGEKVDASILLLCKLMPTEPEML